MEEKRGFIEGGWCGDDLCEDKVKDETMATIRVLPLEQPADVSRRPCVCCGRPSKMLAVFGRAY